MNRDKLIELIKKGHEIELKDYPIDNYTEATLNIESLADHLIANGIGYITVEKHRADAAEEALRLMAERCSTTCIYGKNEDFTDIMKQVAHLKQQAEERLKERV